MKVNSKTKRMYNLVYKLRKKSFNVSTRKKRITIKVEDFNKIVSDNYAFELVREYGFKLSAERIQLKLDL